MNPIHVHLIITHLPIFGTLIGAFILLSGIIFHQPSIRQVAYILFIVCGITAFISSASGEQSEIRLKKNPQFDQTLIEAHRKYAGTAFVWSALLGAASIGAFWAEYKSLSVSRKLSIILFIVSVANFCLLAYVGFQGGKIRHDEIRETQ